MKKFEICYRKYCGCPREFLFVEAENAADAKTLAVRHIKENGANADYVIHSVVEACALPQGRVLS